MASYFITGASRGLALDLVRALNEKPASEVSTIFAAVRSRTDALDKIVNESNGRVEVVSIDVDSEESIKLAASQVEKSLGSKGLDVLINAAGIMSHFPEGITAVNDLNQMFNTNVTGVHLVTRAFLPLLKKGQLKKVINYSSGLASIGEAKYFATHDAFSYKVAKAGMNMLTAQYALQFKTEGFIFIAMSPGWVKTDMGSQHADLDIETSTNSVLDIVSRLTKDDNGKFFNVRAPEFDDRPKAFGYWGDEIPW